MDESYSLREKTEIIRKLTNENFEMRQIIRNKMLDPGVHSFDKLKILRNENVKLKETLNHNKQLLCDTLAANAKRNEMIQEMAEIYKKKLSRANVKMTKDMATSVSDLQSVNSSELHCVPGSSKTFPNEASSSDNLYWKNSDYQETSSFNAMLIPSEDILGINVENSNLITEELELRGSHNLVESVDSLKRPCVPGCSKSFLNTTTLKKIPYKETQDGLPIKVEKSNLKTEESACTSSLNLVKAMDSLQTPSGSSKSFLNTTTVKKRPYKESQDGLPIKVEKSNLKTEESACTSSLNLVKAMDSLQTPSGSSKSFENKPATAIYAMGCWNINYVGLFATPDEKPVYRKNTKIKDTKTMSIASEDILPIKVENPNLETEESESTSTLNLVESMDSSQMPECLPGTSKTFRNLTTSSVYTDQGMKTKMADSDEETLYWKNSQFQETSSMSSVFEDRKARNSEFDEEVLKFISDPKLVDLMNPLKSTSTPGTTNSMENETNTNNAVLTDSENPLTIIATNLELKKKVLELRSQYEKLDKERTAVKESIQTTKTEYCKLLHKVSLREEYIKSCDFLIRCLMNTLKAQPTLRQGTNANEEPAGDGTNLNSNETDLSQKVDQKSENPKNT